MFKFVFSIIALAAIIGCATTTDVTGPDGSPHKSVYCGDINRCYDEARQVCKGNYQIVNTAGETTVDYMYGASGTSHTLLVKCDPENFRMKQPAPSNIPKTESVNPNAM